MAALRALCLAALMVLAGLGARAQSSEILTGADYAAPTSRYAHGVLGDAIEWGALKLRLRRCADCPARSITITLPQHRVFEDLAPRLVDLGPAGIKALVVESDAGLGARLALYDATGLHAATPFIGQTNRWLAPVGAADLDGDGRVEIAYIDRPHLAKTLRIWRYDQGQLQEIASLKGLTNHRIGADYIEGGLRQCGARPEMILVSADWSRLMAVQLTPKGPAARDIGPYAGPQSARAALDCP